MLLQHELFECALAADAGEADRSVDGTKRIGPKPGLVERGTARLLDFGQRAVDAEAQRGGARDAGAEQASCRILDAGPAAGAAAVDAGEQRPRMSSGCHPVDPSDIRAALHQLAIQQLVSAIEMVDAVDGGFSVGNERGKDETDRGAQIGRHHLRAMQTVDAAHQRRRALQRDVGAKPPKLGNVHEAALEHGLADHRRAGRDGHQGHELRLQVGWKSGVGLGCDVDGLQWAGADDHQPAVGRPDLHARALQRRTDRSEMFEVRAKDFEIAAGDRGSDGVGPGLDPVGDQFVAGGVERVDPLHQNSMRSGPLDACSHRRKAQGEIADLGIARRIQNLGLAAGEDGSHQRGLGRPDRRQRQHDAAAAQSISLGLRVNVAGHDVDVGAQRVQRLEVQVDRPRADCAASGHGHARRTEAGQQRREHEHAGAHPAHHVIGSLCVAGTRGVEHQHPGGAAARHHAELAQQSQHGVDVRHLGDVPEFQPFGAKDRSRNLRQDRVLCAADLNRAFNALAATNDQPIHAASLSVARPLIDNGPVSAARVPTRFRVGGSRVRKPGAPWVLGVL